MSKLKKYCYDQEEPEDYFQDLMQESYVQNYQALVFCKDLDVIESDIINQKMIKLPDLKENQSKFKFPLKFKLIEKTFVFDLDETLIHCNDDLS